MKDESINYIINKTQIQDVTLMPASVWFLMHTIEKPFDKLL